jgi:hypothetical protein
VKNHLQRIYRTLGVGNRTAAVGALGAFRPLGRPAHLSNGKLAAG